MSATMLATITSARPGARPRPVPRATATRAAHPFRRTFARATATATGSLSTAQTRRAPNAAAAIARTPEPVPTSNTTARGRAPRAASRPRSARRVLGWVPVPNAMPGSIATATSPARGAARSHEGRTSNRPMRTGAACARHAVAHRWAATRRDATEIGRGSSP
ncbi:MAG TPA: hypothetical protein VGZ23_03940 [bacterium]|nr:hypothetical protein [bacterium]